MGLGHNAKRGEAKRPRDVQDKVTGLARGLIEAQTENGIDAETAASRVARHDDLSAELVRQSDYRPRTCDAAGAADREPEAGHYLEIPAHEDLPMTAPASGRDRRS